MLESLMREFLERRTLQLAKNNNWENDIIIKNLLKEIKAEIDDILKENKEQ